MSDDRINDHDNEEAMGSSEVAPDEKSTTDGESVTPELTLEDYKRLAEEAKAEADRKETLLKQQQAERRKALKYAKSLLEEKKKLESNITQYNKGEVDELSVSNKGDFSEDYEILYPEFQNGPPEDLISVIKEIDGAAVALNYRQQWKTLPPESIEAYYNETVRRRETMAKEAESNEIEELKRQIEELKKGKTSKKVDIPEPLDNSFGESEKRSSKQPSSFSNMTDEEFNKLYDKL